MHEDRINGSLWLSESTAKAWRWNDDTATAVFNSRLSPDTDHRGGVYKYIPALMDKVEHTVIEVLPWEKLVYSCSLIIETVSESKVISDSIISTYEEFSKECVGVVLMSEMSGFMNDLHKKMMAPTVRFNKFAYRIRDYWWIFALAVVISFAISLLSVLWQTLKAARINPAVELKKE